MTRLPYYAFATACLLIAIVSLRGLMAPLALVMPGMAHFIHEAPIALWGHIIFAPIALALAPFQVNQRLRARRPRFNRAMGYGYATAIGIAAVSSLIFVSGSYASTFAKLGFAVLAVLWIGFTATGIGFARQRDFTRHRVWMLRSVALTSAAVTLRVMMAPLLVLGWTVPQTYDVTAWGAWLLNLVLLEVWLRWKGRVALAVQ